MYYESMALTLYILPPTITVIREHVDEQSRCLEDHTSICTELYKTKFTMYAVRCCCIFNREVTTNTYFELLNYARKGTADQTKIQYVRIDMQQT